MITDSHIRLRGTRTHNLKNIDVDIPRNALVVITGLSGSGKSSLAFDTLYAEGQRRYVESLSAYARQFLSMMGKPDVDSVEGLSPAIAIDQKSTSHNPRSTVGTATEIYDYLRLLFARVGVPRCPTHDLPLSAQTVTQMTDHIMKLPADTKIALLAPLVQNKKGTHSTLFENLRRQGYQRVRVDGTIHDIDTEMSLAPRKHHTIELVVDRVKIKKGMEQRLADSIETTLNQSDGLLVVIDLDNDNAEPLMFSSRQSCSQCGYAVPRLEPRSFSFNNPAGACHTCDGLCKQTSIDEHKVIPNRDLSINEGAIIGWQAHHQYHFAKLTTLAEHYEFDLDMPFKKLPKKVQDIILHGSNGEKIHFCLPTVRGRIRKKNEPFVGVLATMQKRYLETDVQAIRDHLAPFLSTHPCEACDGTRLNQAARHVFVGDYTLPQLTNMTILELCAWSKSQELPTMQQEIAEKIFREISSRSQFLVNVGLTYLTLSRSADTLSGGESQRIRLASQIGSGLVGVMYILDEPSIGLHQRDNDRLIDTLKHLRDLGNTVIVVEHDEDTIRAADYIIDMGPGAGEHGGQVIAAGTPADIAKHRDSITGKYLSHRLSIPIPSRIANVCQPQIQLKGVRCNNLNGVDASIPVGLLTCVTGVSGSGKSSLIKHTLYPVALEHLHRQHHVGTIGEYDSISGLDAIDKIINIDQSPIGRTPRSNPATYTGMLTPIRELFSNTEMARARGYKIGRFSFNVRGGRCEACQGDGLIKVEMHFLADVYVTCDQCEGKRYNRETLEVLYKGKTIHDVLSLTVEEALDFFDAIPSIRRKCETLMSVGLSYIRLGQSATTLSGGEAQRIKLARELTKRDTGQTLYLLDEPTTGLHCHDVAQLIQVLYKLRDKGNTVVVIEHNLDVIKTADWIIDLGPEGGSGGGKIIAAGTPETVAKEKGSYTGSFLKPLLKKG